jgi:hypothetical protein
VSKPKAINPFVEVNGVWYLAKKQDKYHPGYYFDDINADMNGPHDTAWEARAACDKHYMEAMDAEKSA